MFKRTKCFFLLNCIWSLAYGMNQYHHEGYHLPHTRNQNGSDCCPFQVVLCSENDFGLHPFPYDCNKYIQCEGGQTIIRDCDNGLSFNAQQKMCNTAYNTNCQLQMTVRLYSQNIDRNSTIPRAYDTEAVCSANSPPVRRHSRACWKYIRCVKGITYIESCPPGQGFIAPFGKCMPDNNCALVLRDNTANNNNYGRGLNINLDGQTLTSTGSSVQYGSESHVRISSQSPYGNTPEERGDHIYQSTTSTAVFTTNAGTTTATNTPYEQLHLEGVSARNHMGSARIKINGTWYYICHNKFDMNAANVFCREIGFQQGARQLLKNSYFITPRILKKNKIEFSIFNEVVCRGDENSLKECEFINWDTNRCNDAEVVGIVCKLPHKNRCSNTDKFLCATEDQCIPGNKICDGIADCSDLSDEKLPQCNKRLEYRLVNGKSTNEGRLQIKYQGIWGAVCDYDFGNMEAQVFCRSKGYLGTAIFSRQGFGLGYGPIWLARHRCTSIESNHDLAGCNTGIYAPTNCQHSEDIRIICTRSETLPTE